MDSYNHQCHQSAIEKITEGMDRLRLQPSNTSVKKGKLVFEKEDEEGIDFIVVPEDELDEEEDEEDINENEGKDGEANTEDKNRVMEKRNQRLMRRLGMELVSGVPFVTAKKEDKVYIFSSPTVYKSPSSESYVIFGEPLVLDKNNSKMQQPHDDESEVSEPVVPPYDVVSIEDEGVVVIDESALNPLDIELMMTQTGLSRDKAAKALIASGNDIMDAIIKAKGF